MLINGGIKGTAVLPNSASASGNWSRYDQAYFKSLSSWPFAAGTSSSPVFAIGYTATPFIAAGTFFPGSGFGTMLSSPGTLPNASVDKIEFSPDNKALLFVTGTGTAFTSLEAYQWLDTGFGTKLSSSITNAGDPAYTFDIHPSGNYVAFTLWNSASGAAQIFVAPFNSTTGFGTQSYSGIQYSTLSVPVNGMIFNPSGNSIIIGTAPGTTYSTDPILTYPFNSSTGTLSSTKVTNSIGDISSYNTGQYYGSGISVHPTGKTFAVNGNNVPSHSPYKLSIYGHTSTTGITTSYSNTHYSTYATTGNSTYFSQFSNDGNLLVFAGYRYAGSGPVTRTINYVQANSATGLVTGTPTEIPSMNIASLGLTISTSTDDILFITANDTNFVRGFPIIKTSYPYTIGSQYATLPSALGGGSRTINAMKTNNYNY